MSWSAFDEAGFLAEIERQHTAGNEALDEVLKFLRARRKDQTIPPSDPTTLEAFDTSKEAASSLEAALVLLGGLVDDEQESEPGREHCVDERELLENFFTPPMLLHRVLGLGRRCMEAYLDADLRLR
ncbi:hypothetical protein DFJ74DRAFT_706100 [Hyaloraphidium curvatum]|nr:hypothetical protein DFJ74DRAFT_706100 [Hyaloraphidium curvatum]